MDDNVAAPVKMLVFLSACEDPWEYSGCLFRAGREQRALEFLELLATDHHSIDDGIYRSLAEVFTAAEIIALGQTCGHVIGNHQFIHTLDPYGDKEPVIPQDPEQVAITWDEAHRQSPNSTQEMKIKTDR